MSSSQPWMRLARFTLKCVKDSLPCVLKLKTFSLYQTNILVPSFEESRARSQLFLAAEQPTYLPWQESESPYAALPRIAGDRIYIDEELRVGIMGDLGDFFRSKSGGQSVSVLPR